MQPDFIDFLTAFWYSVALSIVFFYNGYITLIFKKIQVMLQIYKELKKYGEVKTNAPISKYTTFKIGGKAEFLVNVKSSLLLVGLLDYLSEQGLDYFILGGGSNLLFSDADFHGIVIKISNSEIKIQSEIIEVCAGATLASLMIFANKNSLSGLEWVAGIPGTVGGAIRGNAGALGESISDCIQKVFVWEDGEEKEYSKENCSFSYRNSIFKKNLKTVILKAFIKLKFAEKQEISEKIAKNLLSRQKFPKLPSAGSFFKNIKLEKWPGDIDILPEIFKTRGTVPAGWLIENCGLKGFCIGGAGVSKEHGNFLVNFDKATAEDVLQVVEEIQKRCMINMEWTWSLKYKS